MKIWEAMLEVRLEDIDLSSIDTVLTELEVSQFGDDDRRNLFYCYSVCPNEGVKDEVLEYCSTIPLNELVRVCTTDSAKLILEYIISLYYLESLTKAKGASIDLVHAARRVSSLIKVDKLYNFFIDSTHSLKVIIDLKIGIHVEVAVLAYHGDLHQLCEKVGTNEGLIHVSLVISLSVSRERLIEVIEYYSKNNIDGYKMLNRIAFEQLYGSKDPKLMTITEYIIKVYRIDIKTVTTGFAKRLYS